MYVVQLSTTGPDPGEEGVVAVRERLSREAIVNSAIALADAEGLEAVTIRRLATDQGVTPMALYWHFKDKDLLMDGVAERLLGDVRLPPGVADPELPWPERFIALLQAVLDVLRAHPNVADLVHTRILGSPPGLDLAEQAFAILHGAGFNDEETAQVAVQALHSMVLLVTTEAAGRIGKEGDDGEQQRMRQKKAALMTLSPDRYPHLVNCADVITMPPDEGRYFDLGLQVLMSGIRGITPGAAGSSR